MPADLDDDPSQAFDDDVPGFPRCATCRHRVTGSIGQCVWCASRTLQVVGETGHCEVCSQVLAAGQSCRNQLCRSGQRAFGRASAITMMTKELRLKIHDYKYERRRYGWKFIFSRLLLGHLERRFDPTAVDLVVASPTYTGPPEERLPHTELVLEEAAAQDALGRWPFDVQEPRAIIATGARPRSAGGTLAAKRAAAEQLAPLLRVPDPARIRGKRLLIYDDVFTTGFTLNVVARALREAGAEQVDAVVLTRRPWGES